MEQNYLIHHGIKGMHWGQHISEDKVARKEKKASLNRSRNAYKNAKRQANLATRLAYNRSSSSSPYVRSATNNKDLWAIAYDKQAKASEAKAKYKQEKKRI